jgi:hypothetical protein
MRLVQAPACRTIDEAPRPAVARKVVAARAGTVERTEIKGTNLRFVLDYRRQMAAGNVKDATDRGERGELLN